MNDWKLLMNSTWVLYNKRQPVAQIVRLGTHSNHWRATSCCGTRYDLVTQSSLGLIKQILERDVELHS